MADQDTSAVQAEANGEQTISVEYKGATYTFPASIETADGDVLDAVEQSHLGQALRGLMGSVQWAAFKKSKPKVSDYRDLFQAYAAQIGLETTGNS